MGGRRARERDRGLSVLVMYLHILALWVGEEATLALSKTSAVQKVKKRKMLTIYRPFSHKSVLDDLLVLSALCGKILLSDCVQWVLFQS